MPRLAVLFLSNNIITKHFSHAGFLNNIIRILFLPLLLLNVFFKRKKHHNHEVILFVLTE